MALPRHRSPWCVVDVRPAAVPNVVTTVLSLPDGRDLAFAEYGDPAGLPIVAFHGTPGSHLQLAAAHAAARAAGVRLIVPDRPGYGHSSFARGRLLGDWPRDVVAIADHLALGRFAVIGVSGGVPHALACASALGSRLTAAGVVSGPSPVAMAARAPDGALRWLRWTVAIPGVVRLAVAVVVFVMRRFPLAALRLARTWMPDADRRVADDFAFRSYFVDTSRRTSSTTARAAAQDLVLFNEDWRVDLGGIRVPVRIWHGADDRLVEPWNSDVLAAAIPGAAIELVPDEGHLLFAERADRILRELAELARASDGLADAKTPASSAAGD